MGPFEVGTLNRVLTSGAGAGWRPHPLAGALVFLGVCGWVFGWVVAHSQRLLCMTWPSWLWLTTPTTQAGWWAWCSWVSGPGPGAQSALAQLAAGSTCGLISVALGLLHCGCWLLTYALLQVGAAIVLEVVWGGLWMSVAPVTSLPASYPVLVVLCAVQSNF